MSAEPLSLEAYARALAELLRHRAEPLDAVLARLGTTHEAFRSTEAHWTAELAEAHVKRKGALAMRFAAALGEAVRTVGFVTADAPRPAADAPAPAQELPSFLRRPIAPAIPAPGPPSSPPAPTSSSRPVDVQAVVANMMRSHGDLGVGQTAALPSAAQGPALPFAHSPQGPRIELQREGPAPQRLDTGTLPPAQSGTSSFQPGPNDLTLEQYARVSAELALAADPNAVLHRYRLAEAYWREQARAWDDRVKRDSRLQARCMEVLRSLQSPR